MYRKITEDLFTSFIFFSQFEMFICAKTKITIKSEPYTCNPFFFMPNLTEKLQRGRNCWKSLLQCVLQCVKWCGFHKGITHIFYDLPVKWGKENWMRFICQELCLACHCNKFSSLFILRTQITPDLLLLNLWNVLISKLNVVRCIPKPYSAWFLFSWFL